MDFVQLTEKDVRRVDMLKQYCDMRDRAELVVARVRARLEINTDAQRSLDRDRWFERQDEALRLAFLAALSGDRATELTLQAEVLEWTRLAARKIDALSTQLRLDRSQAESSDE